MVATVVLAIALAVGVAPNAVAQEGDGELTWSVQPTPTAEQPERPNFGYDLRPGDRITDSIRVQNFGPDPLPLVVYASDGRTTETGVLDLLPAGEEPVDLGSWVTMAPSVVVPGGGVVDVPFTLVVPDDAEAGDHTGGIVTSVQSASSVDGEPVLLDRRLGSRVHVRVDGPLRPELTVSDLDVSYSGGANPFAGGRVEIAYTVTNTGNVRLGARPTVRIDGVAGIGGRALALEPMGELLPGSSLDFTLSAEGIWPTVRTEVAVELEPVATRDGDELGEVEVASASTSVTTVPWSQAGLVLVAVGGPLAGRRLRARRQEQEDRRVQAAVAAALQAVEQ